MDGRVGPDLLPHLGNPGSDAEWIYDRLLGTGSFGHTYRVRRRQQPDELAAVKLVRLIGGSAERGAAATVDDTTDGSNSDIVGGSGTRQLRTTWEAVELELDSMRRVQDHCSFPTLIDVQHTRRPQYTLIFMEYCSGGDLHGIIDALAASGEQLTGSAVLKLFVQLLIALNHLHTGCMIHRDLKARNVLVTKGALLKLGDFGLVAINRAPQTSCGTPAYMAPEQWASPVGGYSSKVDMWAAGVLLYELLAPGYRPFECASDAELRRAVLAGAYTPLEELVDLTQRNPDERELDAELMRTVGRLLSLPPSERPSAQDLLREPFFGAYGVQEFMEGLAQGRDSGEFADDDVRHYYMCLWSDGVIVNSPAFAPQPPPAMAPFQLSQYQQHQPQQQQQQQHQHHAQPQFSQFGGGTFGGYAQHEQHQQYQQPTYGDMFGHDGRQSAQAGSNGRPTPGTILVLATPHGPLVPLDQLHLYQAQQQQLPFAPGPSPGAGHSGSWNGQQQQPQQQHHAAPGGSQRPLSGSIAAARRQSQATTLLRQQRSPPLGGAGRASPPPRETAGSASGTKSSSSKLSSNAGATPPAAAGHRLPTLAPSSDAPKDSPSEESPGEREPPTVTLGLAPLSVLTHESSDDGNAPQPPSANTAAPATQDDMPTASDHLPSFGYGGDDEDDAGAAAGGTPERPRSPPPLVPPCAPEDDAGAALQLTEDEHLSVTRQQSVGPVRADPLAVLEACERRERRHAIERGFREGLTMLHRCFRLGRQYVEQLNRLRSASALAGGFAPSPGSHQLPTNWNPQPAAAFAQLVQHAPTQALTQSRLVGHSNGRDGARPSGDRHTATYTAGGFDAWDTRGPHSHNQYHPQARPHPGGDAHAARRSDVPYASTPGPGDSARFAGSMARVRRDGAHTVSSMTPTPGATSSGQRR